jgi:enoyl-CoA hydratase/carnithine racemase
MKGIPVNSLNHEMRSGLLEGLMRAQKERMEAVVIFGEGKGFSAGADINEFPRRKHMLPPMLGDVVSAIDNSDIPVVAGIHGYCFGGALEVALACQYRLADRSAKLAFPEVNIGLIPGAGGTQRLPRLVGPEMALNMCIFGEAVDSTTALERGLVDQILTHDMSKLVSAKDSKVIDNFGVEEIVDFALARAEEASSNDDTPLDARRLSLLLPADIPGGDAPDDFWLDYHAKHLASGGRREAVGSSAPMAAFRAVQIACKVPTFETGAGMERRQFDELSQGVEARALQYAFFGDRKARQVVKDVQALNASGYSSDGHGSTNTRAEAVWAVCDTMFERYAREVALLVRSGLATADEVDRALYDFLGMPHKPSEVAMAWGEDLSVAAAGVSGSSSSSGGEEGEASSTLAKADIVARCMYPVINEGFRLLHQSLEHPSLQHDGSQSAAILPEEVDVVFRHAHLLASKTGDNSIGAGNVFPRSRGGPMFFAENDIGLRDVMSGLKALHEAEPDRPLSLEPCQMLVDTVQACSTLREEMYFRSNK